MQTINQLNETIRILQSNVATKDATIKALEETIRIMQSNIVSKDSLIIALKQAVNDCSNATVSPIVIPVPSPDEIDHFRSKVSNFEENRLHSIFRRN